MRNLEKLAAEINAKSKRDKQSFLYILELLTNLILEGTKNST